MLNLSEAINKVKELFPKAQVKQYAVYNGLFIFDVNRQLDSNEDDLDSFYSVNQKTGSCLEFSVLTDILPKEFDALTFKGIS